MRNSSLVKCVCADNITGLKHATEALGVSFGTLGRGASPAQGSDRGTRRGALGSENAGMSSEKMCENRMRRKSEVSDGRSVRVGLVGP